MDTALNNFIQKKVLLGMVNQTDEVQHCLKDVDNIIFKLHSFEMCAKSIHEKVAEQETLIAEVVDDVMEFEKKYSKLLNTI